MATDVGKENKGHGPPGNLMAYGIPSKNGLMSIEFTTALLGLQTEPNTSTIPITVKYRPVDEARNIIVYHAKKVGAKYLFWIDDDTLPPPFTIPRLRALHVKVASGVYYTKYMPPMPLILKKDEIGGYEDWNYGDVIDVDYIGLGCCLMDMTIFDDIDKLDIPSVEYDIGGEKVSMPEYFRYQRGSTDPDDKTGHLGEDVFFCQLVARAGEKIWVDTVVQATHENAAERTKYFYMRSVNRGAWQVDNGPVLYLRTAAQVEPVSQKPVVKLAWGYAPVPEGYEACAVADGVAVVKQYTNISAMKMKNCLEYLDNESAMGLLTVLGRLAENGAEVEITVPDFTQKAGLVTDQAGADEINTVMGQPNARFRSLYTEKYLQVLVETAGFTDIEIKKEGDRLCLTAQKHGS